ncbi:hypothetical protein BHE74_00052949 [Ensete ventricosum]|nr:hypothetical protein BHE74_00052949 [Ensete ventricosum]
MESWYRIGKDPTELWMFPRRDLHTGNCGRASVTENMTHFKPSKILYIMWKKVI